MFKKFYRTKNILFVLLLACFFILTPNNYRTTPNNRYGLDVLYTDSFITSTVIGCNNYKNSTNLQTKSLSIMLLYTYTLLFYFVKKIKKSTRINIIIFLYTVILLGVLVLINTESLLHFLIAYEVILIPSAFLIYFTSPNKRSTLTTFYFLL